MMIIPFLIEVLVRVRVRVLQRTYRYTRRGGDTARQSSPKLLLYYRCV